MTSAIGTNYSVLKLNINEQIHNSKLITSIVLTIPERNELINTSVRKVGIYYTLITYTLTTLITYTLTTLITYTLTTLITYTLTTLITYTLTILNSMHIDGYQYQ